MKVRATEANSYPPGVRWAVGKVREIEIQDGEDLPAWLVPVKASKAKASKAKASEPADEPAADRG
jgi:hypothetical protein